MPTHNVTLAPAAFLGSVRPEAGSRAQFKPQLQLMQQQERAAKENKGFREPN